jgi:ferrous iron transport protein A
MPQHPAACAATLADLPIDRPARVGTVRAPSAQPEWARQLADIGFTPGETVCVLHRAALGGDPMVVRVGCATFALRRADAACVTVVDDGGAA